MGKPYGVKRNIATKGNVEVRHEQRIRRPSFFVRLQSVILAFILVVTLLHAEKRSRDVIM